jgi:predicted NUDIX family NTP pyrophosphohydrolase
MSLKSAGLLPYRRRNAGVEVLLVHPGGPYWKQRDQGAWSIAKGLYEEEAPLDAARREFAEETGHSVDGYDDACFVPLGSVRLPSGKLVYAWALEHDLDATLIRSNTFMMEWPRGSGRQSEFPEVDRAGWFSLAEAREKISPGQLPFLERLDIHLKASGRADRAVER